MGTPDEHPAPGRQRPSAPPPGGEPRRPDGTATGDLKGGRGEDLRWRALAVCLVAGFMTLLDVSIVNVALPSIRTGIDASQSGLQWVLSGYALTFGLVLVPAGRTGDVRSRRAVFMAGLALFTATSALAGAAQNETWLVAARLLQGVAGGILVPQVSGFIQQMFRGAERGRAFGLLGATIGLSTAVGPLLGGLLIEAFGSSEGWRWVFYVNLPIGLAALPVAYRLLPGPGATARAQAADRVARAGRPGPEGHRAPDESPGGNDGSPGRNPGEGTPGSRPDAPPDAPPDARPRGGTKQRSDLDPIGVLLLGAGTVALLLPFVQEQQWRGWQKWLLVPAALAILAGFTGWERGYGRRHEPLVDVALFRQRSYGLGVLLSLLYFAGFTAIFFILTLYLQNGMRYTALEAGVAIMPFAVGSGVAAAIGGRVVTRFGRPLVAWGLAMVVVGLLATALAAHLDSGRSVGWATAGPLLFAGLGSGLVISPNQTLTLGEVPVARAGSAGGVLQTAQRIGSAAGIAAVGSVFFSRVDSRHADWSGAFQLGIVTATALAALALAVAVADVAAGPPGRRREDADGGEHPVRADGRHPARDGDGPAPRTAGRAAGPAAPSPDSGHRSGTA